MFSLLSKVLSLSEKYIQMPKLLMLVSNIAVVSVFGMKLVSMRCIIITFMGREC